MVNFLTSDRLNTTIIYILCACDFVHCTFIFLYVIIPVTVIRLTSFSPIPGKVKLLLISGEKSASLLDHISRFLSQQFVTWYLRSFSKTKIVKLFCPCMSEHMIFIKNVTNVTQALHQNVTNVTKQNITSKEILTIEFHTKYRI